MRSRLEIRRAFWNAVWEKCCNLFAASFPFLLTYLSWSYSYYLEPVGVGQVGGTKACALLAAVWLSFRYCLRKRRDRGKMDLVKKLGEIETKESKRSLSSFSSSSSSLTSDCCHKEERSNEDNTYRGNDLLTQHLLPPDVFVHICSYLHPREVTVVACLNRSTRELVDGPQHVIEKERVTSTGTVSSLWSNILWKSLWYRDYGWIILDWDVGEEAFRRSMVSKNKTEAANKNGNVCNTTSLLTQSLDTVLLSKDNGSMKRFYFTFGEVYLNYVLAGQNTPERCLLGLHGHIFDFTHFAEHHPGLAAPIRVECGKDATDFFEDIPHSRGARRIASKLCLVIDRGCWSNPTGNIADALWGSGCGLYRAPNSNWSSQSMEDSNTRPPPIDLKEKALGLDRLIPMVVSKRRRANSLICIRNEFDRECKKMNTLARTQYAKNGTLVVDRSRYTCTGTRGEHYCIYYDPFVRRWKAWYTGLDYYPVYVDNLET